MKNLILFITISFFSFYSNANDLKKYDILELKQPKYQILEQDKSFSLLLSRWAGLDNKKIKWNSYFDKKIYKEDVLFNKQMYDIKNFNEAILFFTKNFENPALFQNNLNYFVYSRGEVILAVYDKEHLICERVKQYNSEESWNKSNDYIVEDFNKLKEICRKNNFD